MRKLLLTSVALVLVAALPATNPGTGIPVLDVSNLVQNTTTALKQVQAYAQMVQSYQLQLQQYANMVKNTVAPVAQVWQTAQGTMNGVLGTVNMFQNGNQLQGYLSQFQNVNYWLSAPPSSSIRIRRPVPSRKSRRMTQWLKALSNSKHRSRRTRRTSKNYNHRRQPRTGR